MKFLASDYDGTLRQSLRVAEKTAARVRLFQQHGHCFAIVTGRTLNNIYEESIDNGVPADYYICSNGGMIADREGKVVYAEYIDLATAKALADYLKTAGFEGYIASNGFMTCDYHDPAVVIEKGAKVFTYQLVSEEELFASGKVVSFAAWIEDRDRLLELQKLVDERFGEIVDTFCNCGTLDIVAKGVSKKVGAEHAASLAGADELFVIGDDYNDLPMIEGLNGFGITTGVEPVRQAASRLFDTVDDCLDYLENQTN